MVLTYEELIKLIDPGLLGLMVALYILGTIVKRSKIIDNAYIPYIVLTVGIVVSILFFIGYRSDQTIAQDIYSGIVQGIICGGAPIVVNNLIKQGNVIINDRDNV